jgi:hypothetical protein
VEQEEQIKLYRQNQRKRFEELGERQVAALALQWSGTIQTLAWEWLRERDQLREQKAQEVTAEQRSFAQRTLRWAKVAGIAACVAALVAVVAWLLPR